MNDHRLVATVRITDESEVLEVLEEVQFVVNGAGANFSIEAAERALYAGVERFARGVGEYLDAARDRQ